MSLGGGPFGPAERPMGGDLTLPGVVADDPDAATDWITRALDHVAALPPKKAKTTTTAKTAGTAKTAKTEARKK